MGFNSVTWSTNAIVVIMFKRDYGFSVRMIFAFVSAIILFPSEIQPWCKSPIGLHLPSAASGLWRQQGSPRGGGWVLPRAVLPPLDADPRGIGASKQRAASLPLLCLSNVPLCWRLVKSLQRF